MSEILEGNCGNCKSVRKSGDRNAIIYCGKTGYVIPHERIDSAVTFWRIPKNCPRSDVIKSEKQQPKKLWAHKEVSEILTGEEE